MKLNVITVKGRKVLEADFTTNIQAGAAFLDEHFPGWEHEIDIDHLALDDSEQCVLGQLAISSILPKEIASMLKDPKKGLEEDYDGLSWVLCEKYFGDGNARIEEMTARGFYAHGSMPVEEVNGVYMGDRYEPCAPSCSCGRDGYTHCNVVTHDDPEVAALLNRNFEYNWLYEQMTVQWIDFINNRLQREKQIAKTVEEIVATVGAQPQPVFAAA